MAGNDYQTALATLRDDVRELGAVACERARDGVLAADRSDDRLARTVASDDRVSRRCRELEADCVELLALGEPIAGDLRFVVASFAILTDVERVGDLATNLAEYALGGGDGRLDAVEIARIGAEATELVEDALQAYEDGDASVCAAIADRDDHVDALCRTASDRLLRELVAGDGPATDPWDVEWLLDDVSRALLTLRDLERIADHGVNVAARTLYAVENDPGLL